MRTVSGSGCTLAALSFLCVTGAVAQVDEPSAQRLAGTLAKARESGAITIGYRESSIPFSYLSPRGVPIGYSIDLCKLLVDAIGEAVGKPLAIKYAPVTSDSRIGAVQSGAVDLECGSTTSNVERQKVVSFSPVIFVSGTKLMVPKGSSIRSFRDLGGKRVVTTSGTTNAKALAEIRTKFNVDMTIVSAPDHAASFKMLVDGQVDAFATDDVLLYGLIAQNNAKKEFVVVGDYLSYDPYGVMYRKNDPQLARLVVDTFQHLAEDREIERRYDQWFLKKLPSGPSLDLPMSAQLDTIIQSMGAKPE